jgi:hypothetical protein
MKFFLWYIGFMFMLILARELLDMQSLKMGYATSLNVENIGAKTLRVSSHIPLSLSTSPRKRSRLLVGWLICDRQSVGQSALVSGAHLGPVTNFAFSLKFPLDSFGFVIL